MVEWGSVEYFKGYFERTAALMSREAAFAQCSIAILKSSEVSQDDEVEDGTVAVGYYANLLIAYKNHATAMKDVDGNQIAINQRCQVYIDGESGFDGWAKATVKWDLNQKCLVFNFHEGVEWTDTEVPCEEFDSIHIKVSQ